MTKEYCKTTPISKMGFSQRSSCKAQGIIPRTSKAQFGKKIVSKELRSLSLQALLVPPSLKSRSRSRNRSKSKEGGTSKAWRESERSSLRRSRF
jgi:hypothetical protein